MNSRIVGETRVVKYPVLKKTKEPLCGWEYIVLFTAPRTGVVIHVITEGDKDAAPRGWECKIGAHSETFGEDSFEEFNGSIELSN